LSSRPALQLQLRILRRSRPRLAAGDIFAYQHAHRPERYYFGRVVSTEAHLLRIPEIRLVLIYLYDAWSHDKHTIPELRPDRLLLPPIGTNRIAWTRGYFENVASRPLCPGDLLPQHCFTDGANFFDEQRRSLPGPVEPVGRCGVCGIGLIDELIGAALQPLNDKEQS
jgi:hypothetical protein